MRHLFPFISIEAHREVIAAKDETIALQRETIANLTESLKSFQEAMAAVRTAASAPRIARPQRARETEEQARPFDYANLDINDQSMLLEAARRELGGSKVSAQTLIRKAEHIKQRILESRRAKTGEHGAPAPSTAAEPPDFIKQSIEQAVQQGIAAATEVN